MGEVYRAHDTKLGRDVAIKVLPEGFTADPERRARFESEARVLASFNHPHIGAIYGLEDSDRTPALVLELVDGETLAERLQRGRLSTRDCLDIARQIADGLDAAHRKGVIHRDLKPANIKITPAGVVKVLDFGLAKAVMADDIASTLDLSQSPTMAPGSTRAGVILGTAAYMSPEQARGGPVDTRADIWAFGCVLYELLTRRPPFTGRTVAETFAAILERDPDWKAVPGSTPAAIRELLRRCLEKDATRRLQDISEARHVIERAERGWNRWRVAAIAAAVIAVAAIGAGLWLRTPGRLADRSEWVQLTNLPDSVIHPALSPDGRMVAFVRGPSNSIVPFAPGQVYVKLLPNGEPVQLTDDKLPKMSPAFSPDGTRIAYTTVDPQFGWSTWTVPVLGGTPQLTWKNASGLTWTGPRQLLFSEMKQNPHMGIVAAAENRTSRRDIYWPDHTQGMAHLSYASPDRKSVLLVEMDQNHVWTQCRVVPMDGSSPGRLVGHPGTGCTFGAWSPDGRWIYLTSNAGGTNHIWRQRFPDGEPEQITSGPTEEEGIAMSVDGRSLVTAVALRSRSLWLHDRGEERQVSLEGSAIDARFTPDGQKLLYKVVNSLGSYPLPGDLRIADLTTTRSERLTPDLQVIDYDISRDGQQLVIEAADADGRSRLWLARVDRRLPPQQVPGLEGRQPRFGPDGSIYFRRPEGAATFIHRVSGDGSGPQKVIDQPVALLGDVSSDGRWILGWTSRWSAFSLEGGPSVLIGSSVALSWSPDGSLVSVSGGPIAEGRSYLIPLDPGQSLPSTPPEGFLTEEEVARLPGARRVNAWMVPGRSPDVYAFYRTTTQRNLYRIPLS
jgi:serine/threonine protein kinase